MALGGDLNVQVSGEAKATNVLSRVHVTSPAEAVSLSGYSSKSHEYNLQLYNLKFIQLIISQLSGESGIRTHVRVSPKHAFQACAFSHSAISPEES
jgi:hypothetical protein